MEQIELALSDETLRDGEQQVGVFFDRATKIDLACKIARTGVGHIAVMPATHATEATVFQDLMAAGLERQAIASTPMSTASIDAVCALGSRQVILFQAVSDRLLLLRDDRLGSADPATATPKMVADVRERALARAVRHLRYARERNLQICFAAEDASRADGDYLVECMRSFQPYIRYFLLCDTVGALAPETTRSWIEGLRQQVPDMPLMIHCHNDLGLALENTLQAVRAGVAGVSGTFRGIGERAGNVALEQLLDGLALRFGWEVAGIDYDAVAKVTETLDRLGVRAHPPYSAGAQRHESGFHVHLLRRDRLSYTVLPHSEPEIWYGKHSGTSSLRYVLERRLGRSLTPSQYERLREALKTLAVAQQRSFSEAEIVAFLKQGLLPLDP